MLQGFGHRRLGLSEHAPQGEGRTEPQVGKGGSRRLGSFLLQFEKGPRVGVGYLGEDSFKVDKACWGEQYVAEVLVVLSPGNAGHPVDLRLDR